MFVVCNFNDKNPVVFCGSSNLSPGGEQNNGDNLFAMYDPAIPIPMAYVIESIKLYPYRFAGIRDSDETKHHQLD
jgi:hypothetical protein